MPRLLGACLALSFLSATIWADPIRIPQAAGITIDGSDTDWLTANPYKTGRILGSGQQPRPSDFEARMALAWNEAGLLVGVWVQDRDRSEYEDEMYRGDSIELFVGTNEQHYQVVAGPGKSKSFPAIRTFLNDLRQRKRIPLQIAAESAAASTGGYFIETLLPWSNLDVKPAIGAEIHFQGYVNDLDPGEDRYRATLFPGEEGSRNLKELQPLILSDNASEPGLQVRARQSGDEVLVQAFADPSDKDRTVELRSEGRVISSVLLARQTAQIGVLLPRSALPKTADVMVDGRLVGAVQLEPAPLTKSAAEKLNYEVHPTVFSGPTFPDLKLSFPEEIEQARSGLTVECRFFDANFEPASEPHTPGRYGAELTFSANDGHQVVRHVTLFRLPETVDWQKTELQEVRFPSELGFDPVAQSEHATDIAEAFRRDWIADLGQKPYHAILLAALSESKPLNRRAGYFESARRQDSDWWFAFRDKNGQVQPFDRLVTLPTGYEAEPAKRWPLVVFLHGAGEGDSKESLKKWGPPKEIAKGRDFPFILAVPRSEPGQWQWWYPAQVSRFVDEVEREYRVDPDRIYMTGLSMGGSGTWRFAIEYPHRLAAIAPFCGNGTPECAPRIKTLPIWMFQGGKDDPAVVTRARQMEEALQKVGGNLRNSFFPNVGHNCWDEAYSGSELYEWLLSQRRQSRN